MNEDLAEAIAYGHDVGHPPFGHAGEEELDAFLNDEHPVPRRLLKWFRGDNVSRDKCDFRHNFQSVRLLSFLEFYEIGGFDCPGLNLTTQTLEGILKHTSLKSKHRTNERASYPDSPEGLFTLLSTGSECGHIEGQVVAIADEIAQVAHDLADAIHATLLDIGDSSFQKLLKPILRENDDKTKSLAKALKDPADKRRTLPAIGAQLASVLIAYFVKDALRHASSRLSEAKEREAVEGLLRQWLRTPSDTFQALRDFKDQVVVNSYHVNRMDNKGRYIIRRLIDAYLSDPRQLPDPALARYCVTKRREYERLEESGIKEWFRHQAQTHGMTELSGGEVESVVSMMSAQEVAPGAFRRMRKGLLEKLIPFLLLDLDYVRSIADHIALMTDSFAEREMNRLYGSSAALAE